MFRTSFVAVGAFSRVEPVMISGPVGNRISQGQVGRHSVPSTPFVLRLLSANLRHALASSPAPGGGCRLRLGDGRGSWNGGSGHCFCRKRALGLQGFSCGESGADGTECRPYRPRFRLPRSGCSRPGLSRPNLPRARQGAEHKGCAPAGREAAHHIARAHSALQDGERSRLGLIFRAFDRAMQRHRAARNDALHEFRRRAKVGGISLASSTPRRPLVPAPI